MPKIIVTKPRSPTVSALPFPPPSVLHASNPFAFVSEPQSARA
ncbi:Hypothetical protein A7982_09897 [Minicystis rosea]|nr:Hypothetical protein A7982_09897 [Minicystis rosea]